MPMRHHKRAFIAAVIVLGCMLALGCETAYALNNVDLFANGTYQNLSATLGTKVSQFGPTTGATAGSILGNYRNLVLDITQSTPPQIAQVSAGSTSADLEISNNTGVNSTVQLIWDGAHAATGLGDVDTSGLGSVDLTANDDPTKHNTELVVSVTSLDLYAHLKFTVYSNGGANSSTYTLNLTGTDHGGSFPQDFSVPFSAFSGNADFTKVSAVTLTITGTSAYDLVVDSITLQGGPITKQANLSVDSNNNGKADAGDQIHYTVTIPNPGTQDYSNVQFSDTLSSLTTLNSASVNVAGSTTTANITTGSQNLDVKNITVPAGSNVTITFDATVGTLPTSGTCPISNQGHVIIGSTSIPTDDSSTTTPNDATVIPGDCSITPPPPPPPHASVPTLSQYGRWLLVAALALAVLIGMTARRRS